MIKVPQCTSKFAPKGKAEPPKWPPASKPQKQGSPWMRKPSANARVEQEGGPYEGASQPARQERALTIRTPTAPPMMRGVTFSPGSTGASMCHGITPLATSPEERRNVLQFAGGPRPAPAVDCSHYDPNIQAAPEYYPGISKEGYDFDAAPDWVRQLDNELLGAIPDFHDDEEDRCELPLCAPRVLTGGGYNRFYSEGGVRMHVRACLHAKLDECFSVWHIWQEPPHVTALRKSRFMHHHLCKVLTHTSHVAMESVNAVEDTCIHDIAYSTARLQPRPCFCL